jgi:hypothetical protein
VRHTCSSGRSDEGWRSAVLLFIALCGRAVAGDCRLESSTCVDSTASKTISGVVVTLADVGGCWEYQDTYTCIKPNAIDYCSALTAAGCGQTSSTCSDTAFNGTCNTYTKTFLRHQPGNAHQYRSPRQHVHAGDGYRRHQPVQQLRAEPAVVWRHIPASIQRPARSIPAVPRCAWPESPRRRAG